MSLQPSSLVRMWKHSTIALLLSLLLCAPAQAQLQVLRQRALGIQVQNMNDLTESSTLIEITLRNAGTSAVRCKVAGELITNATIVLQTLVSRTPLITLQPGETRIILAHDIFVRGAVAGVNDATAPIFPLPDSYQCCYRVLDANDAVLIPRTCVQTEQAPRIDVLQARTQIRKIMGFDVILGSLTEAEGGNFLASGRVILPGNAVFSLPAGRSANFVNTLIPMAQIIAGATDVEPAGSILRLVETEIQLQWNGWLPVTMRNSQGLTIRRESLLDGRPAALRDPIFINMNTLLANVPSSGVSGDVQVQLGLGDVLSVGGSFDIPAIISTARLAPSRPFRVSSNQTRWRIKGLDVGQLESPTITMTNDSMQITANFPLTVAGSNLNGVTIQYIFRRVGGYDDRVILSRPLSFGNGRMELALLDGDIQNNGFIFVGNMRINVAGFTQPIRFLVKKFTLVQNNGSWSIGTTDMENIPASAGRITLYADSESDFTFTQKGTAFSIAGVGKIGLGLPLGYAIGLPATMLFESNGNVTTTIAQPITIGIPLSSSPRAATSGTTPAPGNDKGAPTSTVKIDIKSFKYASATQLISIDGGITLSLPRGIEFGLSNLAFDRSGLLDLKASISLKFQNGVEGKGSIVYDRDERRTSWAGSFDATIKQGKGSIGFGADFRYATQREWSILLRFSKSPGYQLSVTPPVWLDRVRGGISQTNDRWQFQLGGFFAVLSPSNDKVNAGYDIDADGLLRIGGGATELELKATIDARGFNQKQRLGDGNLIMNLTDTRFSGTVRSSMKLLETITANGQVNFDINTPADQYYVAGKITFAIEGAGQANGNLWLARKYSIGGRTQSGFHADFTAGLLDWRDGINLGIVRVDAYAKATYSWDIDIQSSGVSGRLKADVDAGFSGNVIRIGFSGRGRFTIDGTFSYRNDALTLDASGRGNIEVKIGNCNPGCNSTRFCLRGAGAKMCAGIGTRVRYNRGFAINVER
jgi:hypothetical protein